MSGSTRLAHIAALDDALEYHLARLAEAERRQVEVHEANAAAIAEIEEVHEKAHREARAAAKERQDAFYAAQSCERAIRKLGYVVLDGKRTVAPDASRLDGHGGNFTQPRDPLRDDAARDTTAAYRDLVDPMTGRLHQPDTS